MTTDDREVERLRTVARYTRLNLSRDTFDHVAAMAARWFEVPVAAVTIVDSDCLWFKAAPGFEDAVQVARDLVLCSAELHGDGPTDADEALTRPRCAGNPLLHGDMGVRFYAAAPLVSPTGCRVGAISILDTVPRRVTDSELALLTDLATIVIAELELRLSNLTALHQERERRHQLLHLAGTLQRSLLPPTLPEVPGVELACAYHTASPREVGGDFYDVFLVRPGRWAFFLGDVQGNGAEAAVVTAHIRHTLRAAALHGDDPADALADLNRNLLLEPSADRFCTLVFGLLQPEPPGDGFRVVVATGGHLPGLWIRGAERTVTAAGPTDGMLVGVTPDASFSQCELHVRAGETLMFYTDGLTESRNDSPMLGEEGLIEHLERHLPADAPAVVEVVERLITQLAPSDDVAVLALGAPRRAEAR